MEDADFRPGADGALPSMSRLRRWFFGGRTERTDSLSRILRSRGPASVGSLLPGPGPFDQPPQHPVDLDPAALPWELRDERDLP